MFRRGEGTTILLVEDDAVMRRSPRQMLQAQGYSVIEAEDGKSALARAGSSSGASPPGPDRCRHAGMSGPELVLHLMDSHPETRFLYMSGYTGELVIDHGLSEGIALLEKPFTRAALLNKVQSSLR